jgi:hypothetical protein
MHPGPPLTLPPRHPQKRRPLSAVTRYVVVPMILLALGTRLGMYIERGRIAKPPAWAQAPRAAAAEPASRPVLGPVQAQAPDAPTCEMSGSFQNNIYPSLLLSFGVSYPEYARCLTVTLRNLPQSGTLQLRIDSDMFQQAVQVAVSAGSGTASLNPELPWNYDLLRRTTQMEPRSFVATLLVDGRAQAQAPLVCTVHSVNEAVSRIMVSPSGQWLDTTVCFAAFVNEDHPLINAVLQEALGAGNVRAFTGYQFGAQSTALQAQAIWNALAARGLSYVNVATDSGTSANVSTQYVRFLDQTVRDKGANCVDASVLFASILRRIGLRPVLLFKPGHCFTGYYDAPEGGRILAFETTMLGTSSFVAAADEGAKELQATLPFLGSQQYSVVDIALCRQQGINPIPYQAQGAY